MSFPVDSADVEKVLAFLMKVQGFVVIGSFPKPRHFEIGERTDKFFAVQAVSTFIVDDRATREDWISQRNAVAKEFSQNPTPQVFPNGIKFWKTRPEGGPRIAQLRKQ